MAHPQLQTQSPRPNWKKSQAMNTRDPPQWHASSSSEHPKPASGDLVPPARFHLPKPSQLSQTASPSEDDVFKHTSLQGTVLLQLLPRLCLCVATSFLKWGPHLHLYPFSASSQYTEGDPMEMGHRHCCGTKASPSMRTWLCYLGQNPPAWVWLVVVVVVWFF